MMFYYMHYNNNNYQCKMCWNKALIFGVDSIKLSFRATVFTQYMLAKMFSIQMLLYTFQSNCQIVARVCTLVLLILSIDRFYGSITQLLVGAKLFLA